MDTLEAIEARRSIKNFDATYLLPDEDVRTMMTATLKTPTSFNIQNYRFVIVRDKAIQAQLKAASWNQAQVLDASMVVLLCADLKAPVTNPKRYWYQAPTEIAEALSGMTLQFYDGKEDLQHDEALRSIGMAAQTLMLAAKSIGYDTCPMIGFETEKVEKIIRLPADYILGMMIVVGKATQPARERSGPLDYSELVFENHF
ncbi:MAG: nitroreductase family protein [Vampirovibrio sp.]